MQHRTPSGVVSEDLEHFVCQQHRHRELIAPTHGYISAPTMDHGTGRDTFSTRETWNHVDGRLGLNTGSVLVANPGVDVGHPLACLLTRTPREVLVTLKTTPVRPW